ncbi:MAG TPA: ATP-binding protein [Rhizomicrobium sp.]|nr:ATP-binding protein [Rhizomicrobium sp.]
MGVETFDKAGGPAQIVSASPMPMLLVAANQRILYVNPAAEQFFETGAGFLTRQNLSEIVPFGSPIVQALDQARIRGASVGERDVDLSMPRHGERIADVTATPVADPEGAVLIALHERGFAQRLDRQMHHRSAVRSMNGMAAVLAHEIKNPLAGIRGAAQLLEDSVPEGERGLTQLICQESDRISALIDRMEAFGDTRPIPRKAVNIHEVLGHVCKVAATGFARDISFFESFDPSLPEVLGDRDQLVQVFLNLVRNAADAVPEKGGEIALSTGYRPGMKVSAGASGPLTGLPLEVTVRDNGAGIPPDLKPHIFDPFVTTKVRGSGLGLALVAKIIGDHGGVIECDSVPRRTIFRVLLPMATSGDS